MSGNNRREDNLNIPGGFAEDPDDEMDYEPTTEEESDDLDERDILEMILGQVGEGMEEDEEEEDDEEDDDTEYAEVEVEVEEEVENDDDNAATIEEQTVRVIRTRGELLRLLRSRQLFAGGGGDDDDDTHLPHAWRTRSRRPPPDPNRFPKVPSDEGTELMNSGKFGSNEAQAISSADRNNIGKKKKLAMRVLERELAVGNSAKRGLNNRLMAQGMIPSSNADMIIHFNQPVYSGQFSDDGNFFFSANRDFKVRMYDTSNPYKWKYYKTVEYPFGQWTLTDASLSPDNRYLAYTSICSVVCLAPTDPNDMGDPYVLDLSGPVTRNRAGPFGPRYRDHGIWSVRYSGDGRELVAGTQHGGIVVYDIEARQVLHKVMGHDDDVNAVCFADTSSPHILYSGSDDTTLKVWDRRSMGDNRAAGAFIGHIEGLTYIDSKGDGRYILSNGKDQSMKLWDLRMVMPSGDFDRIKPHRRVTNRQRYDYRWASYNEDNWYPDPHDNSLVTFRGHRVLRTLIRCHFSPPYSTNSRYVYSGSECGKVFVWNMDATLAGTVDVYKATKDSRPRYANMYHHGWDDDEDSSNWKTCVRDASWHPNAPQIVASAWNGYGMSSGTCTVHSWNDGAEEDESEPRMGLRVNQKLEVEEEYYRESAPVRRPQGGRLGLLRRMGLNIDEDDEE